MPNAYELVEVTIEEPIAVVALNKPERLNPLSMALETDVRDALRALEVDERIRAVVITGRGRAFSAGADIRPGSPKNRAGTPESPAALPVVGHLPGGATLGGGSLWEFMYKFPKPIVAAVNGYALGGGWHLATHSDCVVAAESATFGAIEVTVGRLNAGMAIAWMTRTVGKHLAAELSFTGRRITAREALDLHLVNRVVPDDRCLDEAKAMAREIAQYPPLAVATAKMLIRKALDLDRNYELERAMQALLSSTEDAQMAAQAKREKRPMPKNFKGK